jgi:hypothetical protein
VKPSIQPSRETASATDLNTTFGLPRSIRHAIGVGALALGFLSGCAKSNDALEAELKAFPQPTPAQVVSSPNQYLSQRVTVAGTPKLFRNASYSSADGTHTELWYKIPDPTRPGTDLLLFSDKTLPDSTYLVSGKISLNAVGQPYMIVEKSADRGK